MNSKTTYYPAYSFRFYRALWIHMRPYLLYISGIAGLTGMAIAPNNFVSMSTLILAFVPFFLGYGFGQALTDCFQIDTDSISAPYRPLVKKEVSPKSLGIASTLGLILISAIIVWLNPYNFLFCILTIIGLASYTYFKKRFWFTGPFYNAWIVMLLPIIGYMAVLGGSYNSLVNKDLMLVCALSFAAYANFVLIGYLKDINADRKTGYKTFPVVFGWNKTVWFGDVNVLLSVIFCYLLVDFTKVFAIILFVVATIIGVSGQLVGHFSKNKTETGAEYPIVSTIRAFILWHMAAIASFKPDWFWVLIIFYILFELSLYLRPEKSQI